MRITYKRDLTEAGLKGDNLTNMASWRKKINIHRGLPSIQTTGQDRDNE